MTGNKTGMDVIKLLLKIRKQWWFLTLIMVMGGSIGLMISRLRPPIYEATSMFSVSIDYTQTGALTDIQEDQVMRHIGYVISSDKVMQATLNKIKDNNCIIGQEDLENQSFLDRRDASWFLRIRSDDPYCAMNIVNSWAVTADEVLQEGLFHAIIVDANNNMLADLKNCLISYNPLNHYDSNCGFKSINEIQDQINIIGSIISTEKELSEGLMPALSIDLVNNAAIPNDPVQYDRNLLVLSGMVAGLLMSLLFFIVKSESP